MLARWKASWPSQTAHTAISGALRSLCSSLCFELAGAFLCNRDNFWVTQNFRKQSVAQRSRHEFVGAVKRIVGMIQHAATDSHHLKEHWPRRLTRS